jgi:MFS family permease
MNTQENLSHQFFQIDPAKVLLPLGLGTALSLMGDATLYTVLPTHAEEAGINLAAVGIILSANRFIRLFLNRPTGIAYDRSLRRRLFIPALLIGALSTAIYAASSGFWPLLAGRLLWGLAWSGIWVGGTTIILDVSHDQDRGRWTGLYQTWFFLGAALGAIAGGWLTDIWGYTAAMWVGAAMTSFGAFFALFTLPETRPKNDRNGHNPDSNSEEKWRPNFEFNSVITLNGINRFVISGVIAATLALLVQDQLPKTNLIFGVATVTGILLGLRTILSMFSASLSGVLTDRLGSRWGIMIGVLLIGAIGMLLLISPNPIVILIGICFSAVAGGSIQTLMTTRTGDLVAQAQRGKAIGNLHTAGDLGSALGPITAYALLGTLTLNGLFLMCALLFSLGAGLAGLLYYRQSSSEKELVN